MTLAAKVCSDITLSWDEALTLYREQLRFYLSYLVECDCSAGILAEVEAEVRDRLVPDDFKLGFLTRTVVRSVIRHLRECTTQGEHLRCPGEEQVSSVAAIPTHERLVYFMRDILDYSTRDSSLLMGMSDSQVEQLLSFARTRLDVTEGPSTAEIQTPELTYFKWKIVDFHLNLN